MTDDRQVSGSGEAFRPFWLDGQNAAVDRQRVHAAVSAVYCSCDLPAPRKVEFADGPVQMAKRWLKDFDDPDTGEKLTRVISGRLDDSIFRELPYSEAVSRAEPDAQMERAITAGAEITAAFNGAFADLHSGFFNAVRRMLAGTELRPNISECGWTPFARDTAISLQRAHSLVGPYRRTPETSAASALLELTRVASWAIFHRNVCWVSARPQAVKIDETGRLHEKAGPALVFPDKWTLYAWKGVLVPSWIIVTPEKVTLPMIDRQLNPWVKRCMIDIYTPERYIKDGGAICVAQDDAGKLWRRHWRGFGDDTWAAVEVINGTPEPDGNFKHYYLQVPAHVRTAREAVAWTYGMTERQYANLSVRT